MRTQRIVVLALVSFIMLSISLNMQSSNDQSAAVPVFALAPIINSNDPDLDGILSPPFGKDNCPTKSNSNQLDSDKDGIGDACDPSPNPPATTKGSAKPPTTTQSEEVLPPNITEPPKTVHLRVQVEQIRIYKDHDTGFRSDGEWHLFGRVSCCGGAANSNMPTNVYSFNAPGAKEGEIDTPNNDMDDVTGEYHGNWGDTETVKFNSVMQDFDLDNTNPLSELRIDFFGIEDDKIGGTDLPPVSDIIGKSYAKAAEYGKEIITYLNNLKSVDHLGNVHAQYTKSDNYGVGLHYVKSDQIDKNITYKTPKDYVGCIGGGNPKAPLGLYDCRMKDWPDFSDYEITYRIIDRDNRCELGFTYNYMENKCYSDIIQ